MQVAYESGDDNIQPNLESFRLVLLAWSQVGSEGKDYAALRASRILEWMMHLYNIDEKSPAVPDADCFDIVLRTWSKSSNKDAPFKVEELIMKMDSLYINGNESAKPSCMSFNQVLSAWSKSNELRAAQRAEEILNHMEKLSNLEGGEAIKPNIASYSLVVGAWSKTPGNDKGRRAELMLRQMEKQYMHHQSEALRPDSIIYNLVIDAHSKTSSRKAHINARNVLNAQIEMYKSGVEKCKPDVYSFTSVLGSCASLAGSRKEKLEAFEIALKTFNEMCRAGVKPNHVTYGTMLKACGRLLSNGDRRKKFTRKYFRKACEDGCLGAMAITRLKDAATPTQYKGLVGDLDEENLPEEWIRNVPEKEKKYFKMKSTRLRP